MHSRDLGGSPDCWLFYLSCTLMFPSIWHQGPYTWISTPEYWAFTGANAGLTIWLLASLSSARRSPVSHRKGLFGGIVISLGFLAALRIGAQALHTDLNRENHTSPEVIARVIASSAQEGGAAVATLREALHACYPELEEAAARSSLHFRLEGHYTHSLYLGPDQLRLDFYDCSAPLPNAADAPWSFERGSETRLTMRIPLPLSQDNLERLHTTARDLPRVNAARR